MPPICIRRPHLGGSYWNIAITFGMEKLEWFGYLMVKKFEDMMTRSDRILERDRRTDRQILHDSIGRASIASCGKNCGTDFHEF